MEIGFFEADEGYIQALDEYDKKDAIIAIAIFLVYMGFVYLAGLVFRYIIINDIPDTRLTSVLVLAPVNFSVLTLVILVLLRKKQKFSSIGITKHKIVKSSMIGMILGSLVFVSNHTHHTFFSFLGAVSPLELFYMFLVVSFVEELFFRGYLQTRLYGLVKSGFWSITIVGLLFWVAHVPLFLPLSEFNAMPNLLRPGFFIAHVALNFLHRKYNNLSGPIILHGFLNLRF